MDTLRKRGRIFFVSLLVLGLCACKKNTSVNARLFNPALNEYVANATVVLVERFDGGVFSNSNRCREIASAITDANGECRFDEEKLRWRDNYDYFLAVKESWGLEQSYPC